MPYTDMPLEQLYTYEGHGVRPADFDGFWDEAMDELAAVDPAVQLTRASFQAPGAECFDMWFTGVRGGRVYAKYLRPSGQVNVEHTGSAEHPHPALVMFHGYGMNSGDWVDKLPYVLAGWSVFAMEVRGQGGRSSDPGGTTGPSHMGQIVRGIEDDPQDLFFRRVYLDALELVHIAMDMPDVDAARVSVTGASQGGGLAVVCAGLEPRIHRAAAVYPFLADFRRVWEMDAADSAYHEVFDYFRLRDPLHKRHDEVFGALEYIDVQHFANRIQAPVLMATGLSDSVVPPSAQFAIYNKLQSEKDLLVYPEYGHEDIRGLADEVLQWLLR